MNFRPMIFFALSFAFGIFTSYSLIYLNVVISVALSVLFCALIILFITSKNKKISLNARIVFAVAFTLFSIFGFLGFKINIDNYRSETLNNFYLTVNAKVKECNDEEMQKVVLTNVSVSGAIEREVDYNMNLYIENGKLTVGDYVCFSTYIKEYKDTYSGRFSSGFVSDKIKYYASVDVSEITLVKNQKNVLERVNGFIKETLESGMDKDEFNIAYSLLLGKSDVIDEQVISSFRNTGIAHIFAVSGLHIGFLAFALNFVFSKLKFNKYFNACFTILILIFYSGVCGFTASSIRAVIMCATLILSRLSGEKYDVLSSISLAFILILIISPIELFCVGFQLSFLAVLGIFLFSDKIANLLRFFPRKIAVPLATSISAQISTLPILFYYFGRVSYISVFVNVLFIPIVSVLFIALFVCALIGGIFSIEKITLFLPELAIKVIKYAIKFFDKQYFLCALTVFISVAILYYINLILVSGLINIKKQLKKALTIVLSVAIVVVTVSTSLYQASLTTISVTSNYSLYATTVETVNKKTIIVNDFRNIFYPSQLVNVADRESVDNLIICCDGKTNEKVYQFISKLFFYLHFKNVYLCADEDFLELLKNTFRYTSFYNFSENSEMVINDVRIVSHLEENVVEVIRKDKSVLLVSRIVDNYIKYQKFTKDYELIVLSEGVNNYYDFIKSKKIIEYSGEGEGYSVITDGTYTFKI